MADLMIGPLVSLLKDKVSSYLLDQYKVMQGMEEQRQILARRLPAILDFIDESESWPRRPGVSSWLQALKKVSYEAIDAFDELKYEALRRETCKKGHYNTLGVDLVSLFPARNPIVFRYRMGKKLRKIVQSIEVLVKEMNDFGFTQRQQAPRPKQWRKTVSVMVDSDKDIVSRSREEEQRRIMKILLAEESSYDLLVLPIVGVGGLGKTTFVQLIYNDPVIKNHFELRRWCCVSDEFDVANIARNICHTNEEVCEKALQDLQKEVSGKRYLIVLDDVWNRDPDEWGKLKTCLKQGGQGSVVLTTTRDVEVARIMATGEVEAYNLEKLGEKYLNEIIKTRAFSLQKLNSDGVEDIIDKIVGRCDGSPLAAKAFGSMLSTKTSVREWNDILTKSNIFTDENNRILPILKLSYDDLPSHMKLCFAFCALFPKDYKIDVDTLIQLWMAHDFIPSHAQDRPETIGRETFMELTWRSFFQDVKQTSPVIMYNGQRKQLRCRTVCKIHDLMHDIALSVMGKECVTINYSCNQKKLLTTDARNFLSLSYQTKYSYDFLKKQSSTLRTWFGTYMYCSVTHLSNYKSLRALQLRDLGEHLPRISHLQHLRYLNLSGNEIRELPEEVSILYNLQTLDLSHCKELRQLPKGMKYVTGLQHLYTNGCKSLKFMPPGMGQLTSLQTLTYFVAGASIGCSTVQELSMLDLGGELEFHGLENVTVGHAKAVRLQNKENLTHLALEWTKSHHESMPADCQKKVLDALEPHGRLEMLRIVNYEATSLPEWVTDRILLQHLTELHLVGCTGCKEIPQLCHFEALQVLYLEKLGRLENLCSDTSFLSFPALKELKLHYLHRLERWVSTKGKEVTFPVLETVDINECGKLTSLPEAPKLRAIKVNESKAQLSLLIVNSRYMSLLSKLTLSVKNTEATFNLDSENQESPLTELSLDGCNFFFVSSPSQSTIGVWKRFGKLVDLTIENSDVLIYWPEEVFQSLVSLRRLLVESCKKLIGPKKVNNGEPVPTTNQLLPHLNVIRVFKCDCLVELFILPPSLETIHVYSCGKLELIWGKEDLDQPCQSFTSTSAVEQSSSQASHRTRGLQHLFVSRCGNLVALPNLPPSLKSLDIGYCQELCSITGQLGSLEFLSIVGSNNLRSLDSVGDLPSLRRLWLDSCKGLTSLPGGTGNYPALRELMVKYCPAIDMKPLYKDHQHRLDNLQKRDLSHAHSSYPREGAKLREPKSWKYAIPGCQGMAIRRHRYPSLNG